VNGLQTEIEGKLDQLAGLFGYADFVDLEENWDGSDPSVQVWEREALYGAFFVFEDQSGFILEEAKSLVLEVLNEIESPAHIDWTEVGPVIKRRLKRFFFKVIERSPLILPIIIPV